MPRNKSEVHNVVWLLVWNGIIDIIRNHGLEICIKMFRQSSLGHVILLLFLRLHNARTLLYGRYQVIANANRRDRLNTLLNTNGYLFNTWKNFCRSISGATYQKGAVNGLSQSPLCRVFCCWTIDYVTKRRQYYMDQILCICHSIVHDAFRCMFY